MNIETIGLGAGSYPEPQETKEKCYQFGFNATIKGYGYVYATNMEQAKELISSNDYDDIVDTFDMQIEEITDIRED